MRAHPAVHLTPTHNISSNKQQQQTTFVQSIM